MGLAGRGPYAIVLLKHEDDCARFLHNVSVTPPTELLQGRVPDPTEPGSPRKLIADRYRLLELIGAGGFAQVYCAQDQQLDRQVAVKLIHSPSWGIVNFSREQSSRFLREARTLARLDHPHIIPVYDAGFESGIPWIAMKLVRGEVLSEMLAGQGPLAPERALRLLLQITEALRHAHRSGIIHQDLKPDNLLVEARATEVGEHLWLTDFGLAVLPADSAVERATRLGTPGYAAPERIAGQGDERADIFAVGCIGVELITGRRVFGGETAEEMLKAVLEGRADLGGVEERAGLRYAEVMRRCLAREPADRWQNVEVLIQALDALHWPPRGPLRTLVQRFRRPATAWDGRFPLLVEGLSKGYGFRKRVIQDLDLAIPRGAVYALLGRNGSGKTTLFRTCLGFARPDRGRVELFGKDPRREGPAVLARTGWVPDQLHAEDSLRVRELLDFVSRAYPRWDKPYCYQLLGRFDLPLETRLRDLSRGMRTQVSLVLALAHRPELVLLDDPTLGLDAVVIEELVDALEEVHREQGTTLVFATHDLNEIERLVTHVGLLRQGSLLLSNSLEELKERSGDLSLREIFVQFLRRAD